MINKEKTIKFTPLGFTLIELLAVIIVLGVIAVITIPVIINVVDEAKDKADMDSAYAYLESAKLYYYDSKLDDSKMEDLLTFQNIYDKVVIKGTKPGKGELYATENGEFALAVELRNKCYYKVFEQNLIVKKEYDECTLGWVGIDKTNPEIAITYEGIEGKNGWYTSQVWVHIKISDLESGPGKIKWCQGKDCEPLDSKIEDTSGEKDILLAENKETIICAIGYDRKGNASEKLCSKPIKIDMINPTFSGIEDLTVMKNTIVDLTVGVLASDNISGVDGSFIVNPTAIDTSIAGTTEVTYTVSDFAGNSTTVKRKIIVDAIAPTVTFTAEANKINANGWAKEDFYVNINVNDQSGLGIKEFYICTGNEGDTCNPISGTYITNSNVATRFVSTEHSNNRICVKAMDNNNRTSEVICSDAYKLDKTAPITGSLNIQGTPGKNGWYVSDVTFTTNAGTDDLSGHAQTIVDKEGIHSNTNGTVVMVTTYDMAGNSSNREYTVKVDITRLTTAVVFHLNSSSGAIYTPGSWTNKSVYAVLSTSDVKVDYFEASNDGTYYHKVTASDTDFTRSGTYTMYYRAVSVSGKIGMSTSRAVIMIDNVAPSSPAISFYHNQNEKIVPYTPGNWTTSYIGINLSYTASDASGIDHFEYSTDNSNFKPLQISSIGTSEILNISTFGISYFYARVVDKAGNVGPKIGPYTFKIDNQWVYNPSVSLRIGSTSGSNYSYDSWANKQVCAVVTASSLGPSGLDHYEYTYIDSSSDSVWSTMSGNSMCFSKEGTTSVYFRTVSKSGKKSARTSAQTFKIDTTPPAAPTIKFTESSADGTSYTPGNSHKFTIYASIRATGSDLSGFNKLQCYRTPGSGWADFGTVDHFNNRIVLSFSTVRQETIRCRHTDKAGNLGVETKVYSIPTSSK